MSKASVRSSVPFGETNSCINGIQVKFTVESGGVQGVRRLSETEVDGQITDGSGSISSTVTRTTEFSVLCSDGTERPHAFTDHDIFLRDGHRVSLIHITTPKVSHWVRIVNHDTKKTHIPWNHTNLVFELGLVRKVSLWYLLPAYACIGVGAAKSDAFAQSAGAIAVLFTGALIFMKTVQYLRASSAWSKNILPELNRTTQQLLATTDRLAPASSRAS